MNKVKLGRKSAWTVDPNDLTIIGLDTGHEAGEHPLWDERANDPVDEAMAKNISVYGVIEPITAIREGDTLVVVDGRGRTKAARRANELLSAQGSALIKMPVLLRNGDDSRLIGVMVSANEHRRADAILIKAAKAQRMLDFGGSPADVANAFGVSPKTVAGWTNLLSLSPAAKKALRKGTINTREAHAVAKLDRKAQDKALKDLTKQGAKPKDRCKPRAPKAKKFKPDMVAAVRYLKDALSHPNQVTEPLVAHALEVLIGRDAYIRFNQE